MKKLHIISFITAGISIYATIYLSGLLAFLEGTSLVNPLTSMYRDIWNVVPEHLHGLWRFFEKIEPHMALIQFLFLALAAVSIIIFLASFEPKKTSLIRTPVEMVIAIHVVALYLLSLLFQGLDSMIANSWNLFPAAKTTCILMGALLLAKQLFAKVRLGIFRQSTLAGMLRKPPKATPTSDDVKDLKDSLGIRGLNAPWIKPII